MTENILLEIGKRFKQARDHYGFSQSDFAKMLEIYQGTLIKIEAGKTSPSIPCLFNMAILGFNLNWLIGGDEKGKPSSTENREKGTITTVLMAKDELDD